MKTLKCESKPFQVQAVLATVENLTILGPWLGDSRVKCIDSAYEKVRGKNKERILGPDDGSKVKEVTYYGPDNLRFWLGVSAGQYVFKVPKKLPGDRQVNGFPETFRFSWDAELFDQIFEHTEYCAAAGLDLKTYTMKPLTAEVIQFTSLGHFNGLVKLAGKTPRFIDDGILGGHYMFPKQSLTVNHLWEDIHFIQNDIGPIFLWKEDLFNMAYKAVDGQ